MAALSRSAHAAYRTLWSAVFGVGGDIAERSRRWRSTLVVGALAGLAVFVIAVVVFPYHSTNHDEGVYLMQAAMLLEGQLTLEAGDLSLAFHPWFFIEDGGRLYPKYSPIPAAMFAVTMELFGEPRVTLAAVAAGNAILVSVLGRMAFDRRVGLLASIIFAAAPMTLLTSSVFLPYAPTTLLNLAFAVCYLHGVRTASIRSGTLAGVAIGLAFFARPFTAVLFAAPFIGHAIWSIARSIRQERLIPLSNPVRRNLCTAAGGLAFVGLALAYNRHLTGSFLVFPYEAFAPLDGPGFGYREILDHSVDYTPALALEANSYVLEYFTTRWFTAGLLGTGIAVCGSVVAARRWLRTDIDRTPGMLLAGVAVSVPLGNLLFWGNYNILATMDDPTDGLLSNFGPFYHFDLLVPLSIFAAVGAVSAWRAIRAHRLVDGLVARTSGATVRQLALAGLFTTLLVAGGVNAALVTEPLERNADHTEKFEVAYGPFEKTDLDDSVVFLPTPYGPWQNHPFQPLRNDPGFDGETVYALEGDPERDFEVLDAYPDRTYYRYAYRGEWTPAGDQFVTPKLEALEVRRGSSLTGESTVATPERVTRARVDLEANGETISYDVADPGPEIDADWTIESGSARLDAPDDAEISGSEPTLSLDETDEVTLSVTLIEPSGGTFTYQHETAVRSTDDGGEAIWPPDRTVCSLSTDCEGEEAYLPDETGAHSEWIDFETQLDAAE